MVDDCVEHRQHSKVKIKSKKVFSSQISTVCFSCVQTSNSIRRDLRTDFELIFVGDFIDASFREKILSKISMYQIKDQVIFRGELIGESKFKEFNDCNVLVFPSKVPSETFGLVIVEAMQFFKPSVVTNLNGPRYVVQNNFDSLLYQSENIQDLYDKILLLRTDNVLYTTLCNNARRSYEEKYTLDNFEKKVSSILSNLSK